MLFIFKSVVDNENIYNTLIRRTALYGWRSGGFKSAECKKLANGVSGQDAVGSDSSIAATIHRCNLHSGASLLLKVFFFSAHANPLTSDHPQIDPPSFSMNPP